MRGSRPSQSAAKATGYFHGPVAGNCLLSLQVAWSVERPWALTYHCPLLADGHKHIPSPLSSPCVFWVLIPLEEKKEVWVPDLLVQNSGQGLCVAVETSKSTLCSLRCVSDTLGFKDLLGKNNISLIT